MLAWGDARLRDVSVNPLYLAMQGLGVALCAVALVWARLRRHERRIWRHMQHSASAVVTVLELEESVRELEQLAASEGSR